MEKLLKNQQIPLTQVIDPNTGQAYYSPQNVVYQDKNNTGVTYLKNVIVDSATSASYALTASYAMNGGGGGSTNTGSLLTTASFSNPNLTFTKGDGSTFNVSLLSLVPTSASYALSASFASTASFLSPSTTNAFIQGGNSFGTTALLGTNDNQSLAFETSGSIRMFISSSGKIGINKSSSNATLDISGSTLTSGSSTWVLPGYANGYISPGTDGISIGNSNSGVHIRVRNSNRTSFDQSCGFGNAGSFGMTTSDRITILTGGTTSSDRALWIGSSANNNILKVQGDSRIAINLATATSALHLQGTGATSATTALRVQNANASASLVVLDNGYVGINTGSAQYNLDVNGISNFEGNLRLGVGFQLLFNNNNVGIYRDSNTLRLGGFGGVEILSSNTTISAQTIRLKVFDTGNISLSNPIDAGYRLDVSGSGRFTGDLTITGSLIAPNITGSLLGTASYATTALSASFALTASYIDGGTF